MAPPPRSHDPGRTCLARRAWVDPARPVVSSAACGTARRPGHIVHVVSSIAVRGGTGAVADLQGRDLAGAEATGLRLLRLIVAGSRAVMSCALRRVTGYSFWPLTHSVA